MTLWRKSGWLVGGVTGVVGDAGGDWVRVSAGFLLACPLRLPGIRKGGGYGECGVGQAGDAWHDDYHGGGSAGDVYRYWECRGDVAAGGWGRAAQHCDAGYPHDDRFVVAL